MCCLLVFYVSLALPVEVAFRGDSPPFDVLSIIGTVIDVLFLIDVYVNFRTGVLPVSCACIYLLTV